jgi:hypothetical protein
MKRNADLTPALGCHPGCSAADKAFDFDDLAAVGEFIHSQRWWEPPRHPDTPSSEAGKIGIRPNI